MSSTAPVLIVDDDTDVREAMFDLLNDEGFKVVMIPDGRSLLNYLQSNPRPALVFLDWNMAPMNGADVMTAIAKVPEWSDLPIVLITADSKIAARMIRHTGFVASMSKPVKVPELIAVTERYATRSVS